MAKNWTINEAVAVIQEGKDTESIAWIAARYPMFVMAAAKNDLAAVAALMGEKFTLSRLAKEPVTIGDTSSGDPVEVPKNTKEKLAAAEERTDGKPAEEMSVKELYQMCCDNGIKVPAAGRNKQFYIDKLTAAGVLGDGEEDAAEANTEEAEWEEQTADPYEGKTAKELYGMCKERGIKAEIKKPAKFYADLLRKADEAEKEEAEDDADGWGEEEEETPAPKKNSKVTPIPGARKGTAGKPQPKKPVADDDESWDI